MSGSVYELRVELEHVRPRVWRLLKVPSDLSLAELHVVLQAAMGWEDYHLYEFEVEDDVFGDPDSLDGWEPDNFHDADLYGLEDLDPEPGDELTYVYDFGDNWRHRIRVEEVPPAGADPLGPDDPPAARVLDGARRCPPEDCGGAPGYAAMLEALDDPSHPEHEEWRAWIGPDFDPEAFSKTVANAALAALQEPGGRLDRGPGANGGDPGGDDGSG